METVTIITASKLADSSLKKIKQAISKKYGPATYREIVDPTIIGGIKITIGSNQVDGSVRQNLDQIKQQLLEIQA